MGTRQNLSRRGGSNEYPQSMFKSKNKKILYTPVAPFYYTKVGCKGAFISRTCYPDVGVRLESDRIVVLNLFNICCTLQFQVQK